MANNQGNIKSRLGNKRASVKARLGKKFNNRFVSRSAKPVEIKEFLCMADIIVCGKYVKAQIDSGIQESYVGTDVANLIISRTNQRAVKRVVSTKDGRSLKSVLKVRLGMRESRMRDLDCIVSGNLAPKSARLGMAAIKSLGYRFQIGGKTTYQQVVRKIVRRKTRQEDQKPVRSKRIIPYLEDEDVVSGLDPEEAQEILDL